MSYRWSPYPRWPAAQAEAAMGAGAGAGASAGAGSGPDILDTMALNRLRALDPGNRTGLLNRVLQTYTLSLERMLRQWSAARAAGDASAMRSVAHTLKSSSASVGALGLSALCADVEARLRDGHLESIEAQLDALAAEGQRILAGLSSHSGPA
jgi:HPt (histidine-containing phosphotransfer) domain-containing protein